MKGLPNNRLGVVLLQVDILLRVQHLAEAKCPVPYYSPHQDSDLNCESGQALPDDDSGY